MNKTAVIKTVLVRMGLAALLTLSIPAGPVQVAAAASLTVTTTADELNADGDCSLREAVRAANTNLPVDQCPAGGSTDTITLPGGTYRLGLAGADEDAALTGDLDLSGTLTLAGAGAAATTLDAAGLDRGLDVLPGATVSLVGLTLRNGVAPDGGGVRNAGTLTLKGVTVANNTAQQRCLTSGCVEPVGGLGGGIYSTGTLALTGRTHIFQNQVAGCCSTALSGPNQGGGVYSAGSLVINDSTLAENSVVNNAGPAPTSGGGLFNTGTAQISKSTIAYNTVQQCCGGGIYNAGTMRLTNVTISSNMATAGHGGGLLNTGTAILNNVTVTRNAADLNHLCSPTCQGGGIYNSGSVYLANTLLAANPNVAGDCAGTVISQGYNLFTNLAGCTVTGDTTGNLLVPNARIGPLEQNGNTATHYPRPTSPALEAGNPAAPGSGGHACAKLDQRGTTRPQDGDDNGTARCDIGAVEHH